MRASDFLRDKGRPASYHPKFRKLTGSITSAIFLENFIYWDPKTQDPDGWCFKTADEIEEETGLSYEEQKTARKRLLSLGLMEERYQRLDHRMFFKVNWENLDNLWIEVFSRTRDSLVREQGIATFANEGLPRSICILTHTTSPTTSIGVPPEDPPPFEEKQEEKKTKQQPSYQHILDIWEERCVPLGLPKPLALTGKRLNRLRECAKDQQFQKYLPDAIEHLCNTSFYTGDNDRGWKADIDFLLRPGKVVVLAEKHQSMAAGDGKPAVNHPKKPEQKRTWADDKFDQCLADMQKRAYSK